VWISNEHEKRINKNYIRKSISFVSYTIFINMNRPCLTTCFFLKKKRIEDTKQNKNKIGVIKWY
jgi:hypothetical protein